MGGNDRQTTLGRLRETVALGVVVVEPVVEVVAVVVVGDKKHGYYKVDSNLDVIVLVAVVKLMVLS